MTTETYTVNVTTGKATIVKDPNAVLDYGIDWTDWLNLVGDSIESFEAEVEEGTAEIDTSMGTNGLEVRSHITVAWVKGGEVGETCRLRFRITTSDGRTDDRSVFLKIKAR